MTNIQLIFKRVKYVKYRYTVPSMERMKIHPLAAAVKPMVGLLHTHLNTPVRCFAKCDNIQQN